MQQDGEFACDSDNGATATFGVYQSYAPRFDLRPSHGSHQQYVGGSTQSRLEIFVTSP